MRPLKRILLPALALMLAAFAGCAPADNANSYTTATTNVSPPAASPQTQNLTMTGRPEKIREMMAQRGQQDEASPTLRIIEPREGATVSGSTVLVRLELSGDLKGYQPGKDPATGMGNHVHVILDNQPYEAYYDLSQPFELRNVSEGKHTLRVFPSRPWHESYKNASAFQMVTFNVKGEGGASSPTTANTGQAGNRNAGANVNSNTSVNANTAAQREGKEMAASTAGDVDPGKPLLTYSRPKGDYKGEDANAIMIDFWLSNAKLQGDGGQYRVRYSVDGGVAQFIDKWEPIWLSGWTNGKHTVRLELVDQAGNLVENGGYNSTTREITVSK